MEWLSVFTEPQALVGLLTLTALEIVLGIDNVIFISILAEKLPVEQQKRARNIGLMLAMVMRILLLLSISWIVGLTKPLFYIPTLGITDEPFAVTGKAVILILGGLFLIAKSTREIHNKLEGEAEHAGGGRTVTSLSSVLFQIVLLDIVFSLDSVITAVGMVDQIPVMIAAVVIAIIVMLIFAGTISDFIQKHPTLKMLALSFLILIGVNLVSEGAGFHIPKGYTYFAMAFSILVEMLNLKLRKPSAPDPVQLRNPRMNEKTVEAIERNV